MNTIQTWLPKLSMAFGILSIVLLSCDDFRKNVRKFISRWRYYFAGSIFVVINLFVYLVLTYAIIQQSPIHLIFNDIAINGSFLEMLMPVFLAFVYFGTGAGSFRLGNNEVQFNKRLRNLLEGMFNSKPLGPEDVHYPEKETEQLYAKLREEAEKVELVAVQNKWGRLQAKWREFKEDEDVLKEQMSYLKKINDELVQISTRLGAESPAAEKLSMVLRNIQKRIRCILKTLIKKAQKILVAFAFKYYTDEAELAKYLVGIEVLDPEKDPIPHRPSILNRGLILGFMFGLLFGPLFGILRDEDVIYYCWRGSIVLMLFTGCVSYGVHSRSWKKSVLVAGMGGYTAHLFWCILDKQHLSALVQRTFDWIKDPQLYTEPIVGLSYGVVTALILYALKYHLGSRVSNKYALYAIATLSGAGAYPILHALISNGPKSFSTFVITAWIGAITMSSMSLAVNIANRVTNQMSRSNSQPGVDPLYCAGCHHGRQQAT